MNLETARFNMVEQQIRPWEVLDPRVLELLFKVKREDFVPEAHRALAFVDMEIPLGHDEFMWVPRLEARCLQALEVQPHERVLEVGTGSGYLTAMLASQAAAVVTVEIHADLKEAAEARFAAQGFNNIDTRLGDAACDWAGDGSFDVIVLTGSTPVLPEAYLKRLNDGGRLFVIVGEGAIMSARRVSRLDADFRTDILLETRVKALINAPQPERFVF
jgi:protein-L-isoaspartate(D-aspartate) O-methyltransferase